MPCEGEAAPDSGQMKQLDGSLDARGIHADMVGEVRTQAIANQWPELDQALASIQRKPAKIREWNVASAVLIVGELRQVPESFYLDLRQRDTRKAVRVALDGAIAKTTEQSGEARRAVGVETAGEIAARGQNSDDEKGSDNQENRLESRRPLTQYEGISVLEGRDGTLWPTRWREARHNELRAWVRVLTICVIAGLILTTALMYGYINDLTGRVTQLEQRQRPVQRGPRGYTGATGAQGVPGIPGVPGADGGESPTTPETSSIP